MTPCAHPECRLPGSTHATLHGRLAPETHWVCDQHAREIDRLDRCYCGERATRWGWCDAHQELRVERRAEAQRPQPEVPVETPPEVVVPFPRRKKRQGIPPRALIAARKLVRFSAADLCTEIGCARTHGSVLCALMRDEEVLEVVAPGRGSVGVVYRVVGMADPDPDHVAQPEEHAPPKGEVAGSSPALVAPAEADWLIREARWPTALEPEVVGATLDALQVPLGSLDFRLGWLRGHVEGLRWRDDFRRGDR